METCTLRMIGAYAGSFDLLIVVSKVSLVTTNGPSLGDRGWQCINKPIRRVSHVSVGVAFVHSHTQTSGLCHRHPDHASSS